MASKSKAYNYTAKHAALSLGKAMKQLADQQPGAARRQTRRTLNLVANGALCNAPRALPPAPQVPQPRAALR
jgi:hypothetical protein